MRAIIRRVTLLAVLLSLAMAAPAMADTFRPLPAVGGTNKDLQVRWVTYKGGTNGEMVIEVRNVSKKRQTFVADGIFFVPDGSPEKAPQRLGAAGPFMEIAKSGKSKHQTRTTLRPGETKRLHVEVFCIDSHRSSPSSSTKFSVAKKLLPKSLRKEIRTGSRRIIRHNKGDVTKSKSAIQSYMWKTRNKKWIKIEGERANEKAAPQRRRIQRQRHRNRNRHPQQRKTIQRKNYPQQQAPQ